MNVISSISEMQAVAAQLRSEAKRIGVVPTMGALHSGHLSLLTLAKQKSDVTITTIFVNPKQFATREDFTKYPRTIEKDIERIEQHGGDIIFIPPASEMYPPDFHTYVEVERFGNLLEGSIRPAHFRGVTTVVAKLFNITKPHIAVFGQKDAQQAFIITQMNRDLNFGIEIIIAPTIREADGLAMSSRNIYLNANERTDATVLHQSLLLAEQMISHGERNAQTVTTAIREQIIKKPSVTSIDYVSITNAGTLDEVNMLSTGNAYLISLAVRFSSTRLIDNTVTQL